MFGELPWDEYVEDVKARFGDRVYEGYMSDLKRINQTGELIEYIDAFDSCAHKTSLSEANVLSYFLTGLKDEIGYPVRMQGPKTLQQAYALVRMQDAYLTTVRTGKPVGLKGNFGQIPSPTVKPDLLPTPTAPRLQGGTNSS